MPRPLESARQILYQQTGNVTFQQLSRELKLKVRALFGISPVCREFHDEKRNSTDKLAAQKFEQKIALEKFLAVSLTDTDEEAYLLHKI